MNHALTAIVRQEVKSPVVWAALLAATLAWPMSLSFSPLATTLGSANARDIAYEVAFLLALSGALYADKKLAAVEWLLGRASTARRGALSVAVVGFGALVPSLLSLVPLAVLQGVASYPAVGTMALISVHMAALTLCLKSFGFSYSERSVAMAFLALALPATFSGAAGPLNVIWRILDPAAGGDLGAANFPLTALHVGSIVGLALLAQLLSIRAMRKR